MAPKQKIRIKLKSYWVPLIEDSCKEIMEAAENTNAKTMVPVPLPTMRRFYCLLKSPHVHKDARTHFEIRTHQRMIDILYPTAQTIDSLMQLDIPVGVDVERLKYDEPPLHILEYSISNSHCRLFSVLSEILYLYQSLNYF